MRLPLLILLSCLLTLPLLACGQKGPLYLPGEQPPGKQPKTSQPAPASAAPAP